MIKFNEIKCVHLEMSSLCNARCPQCPRNFYGYPFNNGYPEVNLTLENAKKIFAPSFLKQLEIIWVNGNFGDFVMNPESIEIFEYFRKINSSLDLQVSTNGSARDKQFWINLAKLKVKVAFCLDGLSDTHSMYRQDTNWELIIKNATTFIQNQGKAIWKMILFDHNKHQVDKCRELSKKLGFYKFELIDQGRNTGPVFDRKGNLIHVMGDFGDTREFELLFHKKKTESILLKNVCDLNKDNTKTKIRCQSKLNREIYVSSWGDVFPCCYTGFSPKTYGKGGWHEVINPQIANLMPESINAIKNPLRKCIEWFYKIEESWKINKFQDGRLLVCHAQCGGE